MRVRMAECMPLMKNAFGVILSRGQDDEKINLYKNETLPAFEKMCADAGGKWLMGTDEITQLKTTQAEHETEIAQKREELESSRRELNIKGRQLKENDIRTQQIQDSLDLFRYKVQDAQKENTEMKLKMDVFQSTCDGLMSEKKHLTLELKETKELQHIYEEKTKQLMEDLQNTTGELQMNKREMIGFNEVNRERETKIQELKQELKLTKLKADQFELKLGTL